MNISTPRFAMACCVGLGLVAVLFAVLFAYQAGQKDNVDGSWDVKSHDVSSLKDLANQNLLDLKAPPASTMETAVAEEPEWALVDAVEVAAVEPQDMTSELPVEVEDAEPNVVQSFNYLPEVDAQPIRVAENVGFAAAAAVVPALKTVSKPEVVAEPELPAGVKRANWQTNPFAGKKQATMSSGAPEENEDNKSFQTMDFSTTGASAIGAAVAEEGKPSLQIESTLKNDTRAQAAQYTVPAQPQRNPVAAQMATAVPSAPIISALDRTAATQAVHHIEYGKSLARRSALEAATEELFSALHVLAQANDRQTQSNQYTSALRAGVTAMKEAQDFMVADPQRQIRMHIDHIIETHETRLIGQTRARHLTATQAMQEYFEFAGQQLGLSGGQNVVAAEALYCLGKLTSIRSMADPNPLNFDLAKAVIYHRASMGADPQNHRSANELGVLLAREGRLSAAEAWLKKSLMISPAAQSWGNLAKVHQRKGTPKDLDLAVKASREHELAMHNESIGLAANQIRWIEPVEFIRSSPKNSVETIASASPAVQRTVVPVTNVEDANGQTESPSIAERIRNWVPKKPVLRR